jgi:hypothetical protein
MGKWTRRQSLLAILMALFAGLGVVVAPTASADVLGTAESRASWTNPNTGTVHTFHWRFAVERDTSTSPDRYRYRSRTWCDYRLAGSSTSVDERCNFNMFDSKFLIKYCHHNQNCPLDTFVIGAANWEGNNVTEKLWLGTWHSLSGSGWSVASVTENMQARFLLPNHVTQWYSGCSHWVEPGVGSTQGLCVFN